MQYLEGAYANKMARGAGRVMTVRRHANNIVSEPHSSPSYVSFGHPIKESGQGTKNQSVLYTFMYKCTNSLVFLLFPQEIGGHNNS